MKSFFTFTCTLITFIILIAVIAIGMAPFLLTNRVIPQLLDKAGIEGVEVRILYISPWTTTGTVQLNGVKQQAPLSSHFTINYNPEQLLKGKIDSIVLENSLLRFARNVDGLQLSGFSSVEKQDTKHITTEGIQTLPVITESIIMKNCQVLIEYGTGTALPLTLHGKLIPHFATTDEGKYVITAILAELFTEGLLPLSVDAKLDMTTDSPSLNVAAQIQQLSALPTLLHDSLGFSELDKLSINGSAKLSTTLLLSSDLKSVMQVDAQLHSSQLALRYDTIKLQSSHEHPLTLTVKRDDKHISYLLTDIELVQPNRLHADIKGKVVTESGVVKGEGTLQAEMLQQPVKLNYQGTFQPDHTELTIRLKGEKQNLQVGTTLVQLGPHTLSVSIDKKNGQLYISPKTYISSLHIPVLELKTGKITSEFRYKVHEATKISQLGHLGVKQIRYKNKTIADLYTTVEQHKDALQYSGELTSYSPRPIRLLFSGKSSKTVPADITFTIPRTRVDQRSLPSSFSLPSELTFAAQLKGKGAVQLSSGGLKGDIDLNISEGELSIEESKIKLTGINTNISLPHLPQITSAPHQELHIDSIELGNINLNNGKILFRVDNQETLFIEKSRFNWCSGKVESGSMQLSLNNPEISTTLYCDRLQFSELLSQFGISGTEGNGSLNGRLPIHFTGNEMSFDDGFLFSTPGNSGIVHFTNTTMLRQGLPDMGQAAYLDYSMQAMENFSYNWTKLIFNSIGDDLLVTMQIDGKPAAPLPFGYKKGHIVARQKGDGIQHPIRLDVNFHLPFNQMFKYGQNLQQIMENMQ